MPMGEWIKQWKYARYQEPSFQKSYRKQIVILFLKNIVDLFLFLSVCARCLW